MTRIILSEFIKLKRSKMLFLSIVGVFSTPSLMFIEILYTHYRRPYEVFTLNDVYDNSLFYMMILTNMMIYVTIAAYLFSREYTEGTLKTILSIPISRKAYIISKFVVLLFWIIFLTFITWIGILGFSSIYHILFRMEGYSIKIAFNWLKTFLIANTLLFFTITPFAYIAVKTKGIVAPMIISAVIVMGSAAICNQDFGAFYPWVASYFLITGKVNEVGYSSYLVTLIIMIVFFVGYIATTRLFETEDIK